MARRLLLLSQDAAWSQALRNSLADQPYEIRSARTPGEAWEIVTDRHVDILLLDIDLPALERLRWFKLLRETEAGRELAVVLASVDRADGELADAFDSGADDFIQKDCEPVVLGARLRSVLRRLQHGPSAEQPPMTLGAVTIDTARHLCYVRRERRELNPRQFELLATLMRKAGRVLTRSYLLETVWGMARDADTRTVDVAISRLRRALGQKAGRWVETVERYGYRFRDPSEMAR